MPKIGRRPAYIAEDQPEYADQMEGMVEEAKRLMKENFDDRKYAAGGLIKRGMGAAKRGGKYSLC